MKKLITAVFQPDLPAIMDCIPEGTKPVDVTRKEGTDVWEVTYEKNTDIFDIIPKQHPEFWEEYQ